MLLHFYENEKQGILLSFLFFIVILQTYLSCFIAVHTWLFCLLSFLAILTTLLFFFHCLSISLTLCLHVTLCGSYFSNLPTPCCQLTFICYFCFCFLLLFLFCKPLNGGILCNSFNVLNLPKHFSRLSLKQLHLTFTSYSYCIHLFPFSL